MTCFGIIFNLEGAQISAGTAKTVIYYGRENHNNSPPLMPDIFLEESLSMSPPKYYEMPIFYPILSALLIVLLSTGCEGIFYDLDSLELDLDTGFVEDDADFDGDVEDEQDADGPDGGDITETPDINACGGILDLAYRGSPAEPGQSCGDCSDGVLVCDGEDRLKCFGDGPLNACEGCGPLPGVPEEDCGICGGEWTCTGSGTLECVEENSQNICGGCEELDGTPGFGCTSSDAVPGILACTSLNDLSCISGQQNACGGVNGLDAQPGTPCGECNLGVVVCDGPESVYCENEDWGLNACEGCSPLAADLGAECGQCSGIWSCLENDALYCLDEGQNRCGGCEELTGGVPGLTCAAGARWICDGEDDLFCSETANNACGGDQTLTDLIGDSCGPCDDGRLICNSPNALSCLGASQLNECGGCGLLPGEEGEPCGSGAVWTCRGDSTMRCEIDDTSSNSCGGTDILDGLAGAPCGPCNLDIFQCISANEVVCSAATACPDPVMEEVTDVTEAWATVQASLQEYPPTALEDHGFCYGLQSLPDALTGNCVSLGSIDEPAPHLFGETLDGLVAGQAYFVRAYVVTQGAVFYGEETDFITIPLPPEDVVTTSAAGHVTVSWESSVGATEYKVIRDPGSADEEILDLVLTTTIDDENATDGGPPSAMGPVTVTNSTAFVQLQWEEPAVVDGPEHQYIVIAINANGLESAASESATGHRSGAPVDHYEVSINGDWTTLGNITSWNHMEAPEGLIVAGTASASQGSSYEFVELESSPATTQQGEGVNEVHYRIRAVNVDGQTGAQSEEVGGHRLVGAITYQWQRTDVDDSSAAFSNITAGCASELECQDTTVPLTGESRWYRLRVSAVGVDDPVYSGVVEGHRLPPFCGGVGNLISPWQICSPQALNRIADFPQTFGDRFRVTENLNLAELPDQFNMIGTQSNSFTGTFDGNGRLISNLYIEAPLSNHVGLFRHIGATGTVQNLHLVDISVQGASSVGGLAGENVGEINNVEVSGSVIGGSWIVGGIVGSNWSGTIDDARSHVDVISYSGERTGGIAGFQISTGRISNCIATGSVTGPMTTGGVVGESGGTVENCRATGNVAGSSKLGGLAGVSSGTIRESRAQGQVQGTDEIGGLVGRNTGDIRRSYSTGSVEGSDDVGGLVGVNGTSQSAGTVLDSYSTSPVDGNQNVGGLVGLHDGSSSTPSAVTRSYSSGSVTASGQSGGLIGANTGGSVDSTSCWDTITSGQSTSEGGLGRATLEFSDEANFSGWNFSAYWVIDTAPDSVFRPILQWQQGL